MADTFQWTTPGTSGTFDVAADWTDTTTPSNVAFPGSLDTADLIGPTTGTAQTITGPGDVSRLNIIGLSVLAGSFTTAVTSVDNLGAASLELDGTLTTSGTLLVGNANSGTLTVDQNSTLTANATGGGQVYIGNVGGSSGAVTITAGGTLNVAGASELTVYGVNVGDAGSGTLDVVGAGAAVNDQASDGIAIGETAGSTGTLIVSSGATADFATTNSNSLAAMSVGREGAGTIIVNGAGSTLTANGGAYIGRGGTGTLIISNSGVVTESATDTYFEFGEGASSTASHIGGTGTGTVESDGTLSDAGYMRIGGYGVSGALTVETGGLVTAAASTTSSAIVVGGGGPINGVFEGGTGSLEIDAGSTVDVTGPASPGVGGVAVAGGTGDTNGTVDVNGAGAVLNAGANLIVVGSSGTGVMNVTDGGAITGTSPGSTYGAIVIGNSAGSVGILTVSGVGSTATANGPLTVGFDGTGTLDIFDGGLVSATNGNVGSGSEIQISGSSTLVTTDGISLAAGGAISGDGVVNSAISGSGAITATGGTLTLADAVQGVALNIASDGDLVLGGSVPVGEGATFLSGESGRIDLLSPGSFAGILNVIDAGDTIFAAGAASASLAGGILTLFSSSDAEIGTIELGAGSASGAVADNGGTITIACFATGTRIATPEGAVAVEALRVGDTVTLAAGGTAPVTWLGHRRVDCARHSRPWDVMPVRVRADAFGPGQPHADLLLSPDHAVLVDGHLIPVRYLLNGATIVQEQVRAITYWHVELPSHDVLLAEGLPAESFLDTGNRDAFADAGAAMQLHPDFSRGVWVAEGCAPLLLDGPEVAATKQTLLDRAVALGYVLTEDSGLLVTVDGREVPVETDGRQWRAVLPEGAQTVRLISRTWNPAHTRAEETDTRTLGVALSHLWLNRREVGLDSPVLTAGWHPAEAEWRWTDGAAEVPVAGMREIAFTLAMPGLYWRDAAGRDTAATRAA